MVAKGLSLGLTVDADVALSAGYDEGDLESLVAYALTELGCDGEWEVSILFTSDERIQHMHNQFMGIDAPTDIMTFPYEDDDFAPGGSFSQGGDLVISVETAEVNAIDHGWPPLQEIRFLVLHGVLHLLNWNDTDADSRKAMLDRQGELLSGWEATKAG
jgi:probable rRNA maturation factor